MPTIKYKNNAKNFAVHSVVQSDKSSTSTNMASKIRNNHPDFVTKE